MNFQKNTPWIFQDLSGLLFGLYLQYSCYERTRTRYSKKIRLLQVVCICYYYLFGCFNYFFYSIITNMQLGAKYYKSKNGLYMSQNVLINSKTLTINEPFGHLIEGVQFKECSKGEFLLEKSKVIDEWDRVFRQGITTVCMCDLAIASVFAFANRQR